MEVGRFRGVDGDAVEVDPGRERPLRRRAGAGGHRRRLLFLVSDDEVGVGAAGSVAGRARRRNGFGLLLGYFTLRNFVHFCLKKKKFSTLLKIPFLV